MCRISSPIHCTPPRTIVVECVVVVAVHCHFIHVASNKKSFSKVKKKVKKKNIPKGSRRVASRASSVVLLLEPLSLSAMVVVAVRCRFVHVASNKKSFSKVKKKKHT